MELYVDIKEVDQAFSAMKQKLQTKILNKAVKKSTKPIMKYLKIHIPKITGGMSTHINFKAGRRDKTGAWGRVRYGTREQMGILPTNKYHYPTILEYGSKRGIRENAWMGKAYDRYEREARKIMEETILQDTLKLWKR